MCMYVWGVPEEAERAFEIPWSHVSAPSLPPSLFGSVFTMLLLTVLWSPFQQLRLVFAVFAVPTQTVNNQRPNAFSEHFRTLLSYMVKLYLSCPLPPFRTSHTARSPYCQ